MKHIVAPGRVLRHSKVTYPAGSDAPDLPAADLAQFIADGTLVVEAPPVEKPKPVGKPKAEK